METVKLRNDQWKKILGFLRDNPKVYVGEPRRCRRFIEGVLWIMRSGAQWRLLPCRYGRWNSVYKRFGRWAKRGVWQAMFEHFADDPDMEHLILDSSVVRAHMSAAGAAREKGGKQPKRSAGAAGGSVANCM